MACKDSGDNTRAVLLGARMRLVVFKLKMLRQSSPSTRIDMSEENQLFRGDRDPEFSRSGDDVEKQKAAALRDESAPAPVPGAASTVSFNGEPAPAAAAASFNDEPAPEASADTAAPAEAPAAAPVAPEAALKFEIDRSQLWQVSEAMVQRMSQLRSTAAETGHMLDEQEAEARRLEKQLKSL